MLKRKGGARRLPAGAIAGGRSAVAPSAGGDHPAYGLCGPRRGDRPPAAGEHSAPASRAAAQKPGQ